jgi:hypothetical protein
MKMSFGENGNKIMDFTDWLEYKYQGELIETDYDYYLARQEYLTEFRPSIFVMGLNPRWQLYKFLPDKTNVMYSANGFWDNEEREWRKKHKFRRRFGIKWLDCGGYLILLKYGYYPFSVVNYANLIVRLSPHFYATMDFACEPGLVNQTKSKIKTVRGRIEATVKNAVELAEWENQIPGQMVPVIQGYTLDEYLYCLQLHEAAGTIRDYMAVGSMCQRTSEKELQELIPGIYYAAQALGCSKLHFFGLKLSPALKIYDEMIYSRDSAVAMDSYDSEIRAKRDGRRFPRGQDEKRENFEHFLRRLDEMGLNYKARARNGN